MSGGGGGSITGNNFLDMGVMIGASMLAPELAPEFLMAEEGGLGLSAAQAAGVTGAALGGGIQAIAGGNPLMGAITGGIGGYGAGGGFNGLFGGAETANPSGLTTTTGGGITAAAPAAVGPEVAGTIGASQYAPEFMSEAVPNVAPEVGATGDMARSAATGGAQVDVNGLPYSSTPAPTNQVPGVDQASKGWFGSLSPLAKAGVVGAGGLGAYYLLNQDKKNYGVPASATQPYTGGNLDKLHYDPSKYTPTIAQPPNPVYQANYAGYARPPGYAGGGLLDPNSEPVDFMGGDMYPQSQQQRSYYATPTQMPTSAQQSAASYEPKTNPLTGEPSVGMADGGLTSIAPPGQFSTPVPDYSSMYFDPQTGQYVSNQKHQSDLIALAATKAAQDKAAADAAAAAAANAGGGGGDGGAGAGAGAGTGAGAGGTGGDGGGDGGDARGGYYSRNRFDYHPAKMAGGGSGIDALKDLMGSRAAIQKYKSQYSQSPSAVYSKAQDGDYNAMLALNHLRGTPNANYASGGISSLGGYSDGGRMLKGPGDGMSDSIPATIKGKQPARLADNEFVVPADVVSHLGNGSSDAGAKKLYNMMDKVRKARTGKSKQAPAIKADKYLPA